MLHFCRKNMILDNCASHRNVLFMQVEGTINISTHSSWKQLKILNNIVASYLRAAYTFVYVGAWCHTSKSINKSFMKHGILVLSFCGNPLDVNRIENCCPSLKWTIHNFANSNINLQLVKWKIHKFGEEMPTLRKLL